MSWSCATLGELIDIRHGFAFKGAFFSDTGQYILLTPGNCHESGGLKLKGAKEKYYTGDIPEDYLLSAGDLLVVMTDLVNAAPILGGAFIIPDDNRFLHNQRLGLVSISNGSQVNKKFLYYLLNTGACRGQVRGSASGATVRHTSPERIKRCEVRIPDSTVEQARIASILSAYDDLIENNRRRIQLLEQSARLLYKEWFIHRRFPGHEHVTITDGLPEGWEIRSLSDIATKIGSGATPRGGAAAYQSEGTALIRSLNVYDYQFEDEGLAHINDDQAEKLSAVAVDPSDILLNITGASVARCCMVPERHLPARVNQHVMIIRIDSSRCGPHYILNTINSHQQKQKLLSIGRAGGATREALTKGDVQSISLPVPSGHVLDQFEETAGRLFDQRQLLAAQNSQLARARDLLLPRLMNGEISA